MWGVVGVVATRPVAAQPAESPPPASAEPPRQTPPAETLPTTPPPASELAAASIPSQATSSPASPVARVPAPAPSALGTAPAEQEVAAVDEPQAEDSALRYVIERIEIEGNTRTNASVILRYLPFHAGDVLDVDDPVIDRTRFRLLSTGFFLEVSFQLRKGARPGRVVLVVHVKERNTIVVNGLWIGIASNRGSSGVDRPVTAFGGLDVAETNLAGTGVTLGSALVLTEDQFAMKVRFLDPAFIGSPWMVSGDLFYNDGRSFFGSGEVHWDDPNQVADPSSLAVVDYNRFGGSFGVGHFWGSDTQVWGYYQLQTIDAELPLAASHEYGGEREPLFFDVLPGVSLVSSIKATLQYDTRDHPVFPTQGWLTTISGELALPPLGSDYAYQRAEISAAHWWRAWREHIVSLSLFGGAIAGNAPFMEQYYVGDLTDFRPPRILGVTVDHRGAPNLLDTAIAEVRYGTYAAKVNGEYRVPLYRGFRSVYGIDFFFSTGLYLLASDRELLRPPADKSGVATIPMDLTANLGFRLDTSIGGFQFAFSNILGFLPPLNRGNQ